MSNSSPDAEELTRLITLSILGTRVQIAGIVISLYDYALTFPLEVSEIWNPKLNGAQVLYIWTRYTFIVNMVINLPVDGLLGNHDFKVSDQFCRGFHIFSVSITDLLTQIGLYSIMIMRTYAIYHKSRWVLVTLGTVSVVVCALGVYYTDGLGRPYAEDLGMFRGCAIPANPNVVLLSLLMNVSTFILDALVFGLTVAKTLRHTLQMKKSGMAKGLTYVILRDGLMYFLAKLLVTIFGFVIFWTPNIDVNVITLLPGLSHPIIISLISRFVLNLRRVSPLQEADVSVCVEMSTLCEPTFASNPLLGNIGAPLRMGPEDDGIGQIPMGDGIENTKEREIAEGVEELQVRAPENDH